MRLIYWLLAIPLAVAAVLFAVSNLGAVELALWPLPFTLNAPVYLIALGGLLVGFLAGGIVAWLGAGGTRGRARTAERAVRLSNIELEELRARVKDAEREAAARKAAPPEKSGLPAPVDARAG